GQNRPTKPRTVGLASDRGPRWTSIVVPGDVGSRLAAFERSSGGPDIRLPLADRVVLPALQADLRPRQVAQPQGHARGLRGRMVALGIVDNAFACPTPIAAGESQPRQRGPRAPRLRAGHRLRLVATGAGGIALRAA